jgi:hypothetical protein
MLHAALDMHVQRHQTLIRASQYGPVCFLKSPLPMWVSGTPGADVLDPCHVWHVEELIHPLAIKYSTSKLYPIYHHLGTMFA